MADKRATLPAAESEARIADAALPNTGTGTAHSSGKPLAQSAVTRENWPVPDYQPVRQCGEGSFGAVWAVRDRVGVFRAMKLIDLDRHRKAGGECFELNALQTYCRKVARHPHLITIFHVGIAGSYLYYTMELADHQTGPGLISDSLPPDYRPLTLRTIVKKKRLHPELALEIAVRLLRGLARLHELDLVHHDIKPSNIVIVDRQPKLADIGVMTSSHALGKGVGTPRYMPPDKSLDKTGDVFALGKVLHEMIAGPDAAEFPALPEAFRVDSARWDLSRVEKVLERACAPKAADRYAHAGAMLEGLEACARLTYGSLFDELEERRPADKSHPGRAAVQITLAVIDKIPWIAGGGAALYAISKLM